MSADIFVAHAGGTGWDEIAVFVLPVVILVGLQALGRRRARSGRSADKDGTDGEGKA